MDTKKQDALTELERLYAALSVRTQVEAANILGVRQSAFSGGKRVAGAVLESALRLGVSREWIQEGKLPMRIVKAPSLKKCEAGQYCLETCPALEAVQQAVRLIAHCPHICGACKVAVATQANGGAGGTDTISG